MASIVLVPGALRRMMTAKLSGQEIDIVACWANGADVRRGVLKPINEEIKLFESRIDPEALSAFTAPNTSGGTSG